MITCLECNAENFEGALYCENCGADLEGIIASDNSSQQEFIPVGGPALKLVLADTGEEIGLPEKEEILVGREDPASSIFPDMKYWWDVKTLPARSSLISIPRLTTAKKMV